MERETGIEPATSSLGSYPIPCGLPRINGLEVAMRAKKGVLGCSRRLMHPYCTLKNLSRNWEGFGVEQHYSNY
jgi:hypothetical protein